MYDPSFTQVKPQTKKQNTSTEFDTNTNPSTFTDH